MVSMNFIKEEIYQILDNPLNIQSALYIPNFDDPSITFGLTGKRFECVCLYIDMRGSTKILEKHNANVVIKIHKSFFITILRIVRGLKGEVRSFNGDSVLAFFLGHNSETITNAIKAAMQIKNALIENENSLDNIIYTKYGTRIDIGMGLDLGTTVAAKVGHKGLANQDFIWIGSNVNHAVKISDERQRPHSIGITNRLYDHLSHIAKYSNGVNMWTKQQQTYNETSEIIYTTSYYWEI